MIFYKETEIQDTPIGLIPKDWKFLKLGHDEICEDIFYGLTAKATERNTGLKMLRTTDIKNYSAEWDKLPFCEITERRNALDKYFLKRGDIVIARAGTVGVSVLADRDLSDVIFGSYLIKVKLKPLVLPKFIHYFLQSKIYWKHIARAQGSTLKNINLPILKSLYLPVPSLQEQKAITEVLGVVDSAVELVDRVIWKTERLKKGLMQTLLTRGIGHKEYKQTPIGTIPKTWKVARLEEIAEINREKRDPAKTMPHETFVYIDIDSVENETGKIRNPKKILGKDAPSRARRVVHENDVIMSTVRPYLKAFAIIPKEYDNQICSTGFAVLSCKDSIIPYFLLSVLLSDGVIKQCNKMMVGGQYPALNQSQVSRIKIPLPPLDEQKTITSIFWATDKKLEIERSEKAKLERVKQGLMDLLLTGKIRVKVS
jgi:type I restriction enzyme S subunit